MSWLTGDVYIEQIKLVINVQFEPAHAFYLTGTLAQQKADIITLRLQSEGNYVD